MRTGDEQQRERQQRRRRRSTSAAAMDMQQAAGGELLFSLSLSLAARAAIQAGKQAPDFLFPLFSICSPSSNRPSLPALRLTDRQTHALTEKRTTSHGERAAVAAAQEIARAREQRNEEATVRSNLCLRNSKHTGGELLAF